MRSSGHNVSDLHNRMFSYKTFSFFLSLSFFFKHFRRLTQPLAYTADLNAGAFFFSLDGRYIKKNARVHINSSHNDSQV